MAAKKKRGGGPKPGQQKRSAREPDKIDYPFDPAEIEVGNEYFRELMGLGDSRIRELGQHGILVRSEIAGRLLLVPSLERLVREFGSSESNTERATKEARRRTAENTALQGDMKIDADAGKLLDREMADAVLADLLVAARQGLESIMVIVDASAASVDDKSKCRQILGQSLTECGEILERTAQAADDFYGEDDGFGDESGE